VRGESAFSSLRRLPVGVRLLSVVGGRVLLRRLGEEEWHVSGVGKSAEAVCGRVGFEIRRNHVTYEEGGMRLCVICGSVSSCELRV